MFESISIGQKYDRKELAQIWGYKRFQAISRGVFTPKNKDLIVLFATKEQQKYTSKYTNAIENGVLYFSGETSHLSDSRIKQSLKSKDEIHLFYRELHRSKFTYYGEIELREYVIHSDQPSEFVFRVSSEDKASNCFDDIKDNQRDFGSLEETEKTSIVNSRIGQGQFRRGVIALWESCAVTGLKNTSLLKASHIKPWRDSDNSERLNPMNGLLLQPNIDHLFDAGFISFAPNGQVILSARISQDDLDLLGLTTNMTLRKVPEEMNDFLNFHRQNVFKG